MYSFFKQGLTTVIASAVGFLLGGWIIKRFDLHMRGILRLCCCCLFFGMLLGPAYLAGCNDTQVTGVRHPYTNETDVSLTSSCNRGCGCTTSGFEPVCDNANVVYFSPCHAGCSSVNTVNGSKVFEKCSCIWPDTNRSTTANTGTCPSSQRCQWLYIFLICNFLMAFLTCTSTSPLLQGMIRSVQHTQRSSALGIQSIFTRVLGNTLGPIVFGSILDSSCDVWQNTCDVRGNCWIYMEWNLKIKVMAWWISSKFIGVIALLLASMIYKPPSDRDLVLTMSTKGNPDGQDNSQTVFGLTNLDGKTQSNVHFTKL